MTRITFFMSWYCTAQMTAKRKHKIAPPNKLQVLSDCWSGHDNCKGSEVPVIKNVHDCHCRECNSQKDVMLQGATMTNDGWLQRRRACQATTYQIFSCITGASDNRKTTTSSTRWSIFMSYAVLQEATTMAMAVDCNERTRSPKRQPTLWLMWIDHINDGKGAKRQG